MGLYIIMHERRFRGKPKKCPGCMIPQDLHGVGIKRASVQILVMQTIQLKGRGAIILKCLTAKSQGKYENPCMHK